MNLKRRNRAVGEVYSASLNDIMFFLLLFFLITSTMATPNVLKLLLPNAKSSTQSVKHPITISVTEDLQYALNNTPSKFGRTRTGISKTNRRPTRSDCIVES